MKNVALITGASSGIGKELAVIHAEHGGNLLLVARREQILKDLQNSISKKYSVQVEIFPVDLTRPDAPNEIYNFTKANNIEVEFLINNAGIGGLGKFHERSLQQDITMIQLNITALTSLCKLFLPDFVAKNRGRILNVSSTAGFVPGPLQAVYYATKAYVTYLSYAIAEELTNTNVTVTTLLPGATKTEFAKKSGLEKTIAFQKTASAKKVALDGYNAMLTGKLKVISGLPPDKRIMLFFTPFAPIKLILKQVKKLHEIKK